MSTIRPIVMSIAGFDPSGGAGVLADCKTFEYLKTYGLALLTANTLQTADTFISINWSPLDRVLVSLDCMLVTYDIQTIKIGITPNYEYIYSLVKHIKTVNPNIKIVWDPVLKSTTNFSFIASPNPDMLSQLLGYIDLITPNINEIQTLVDGSNDPIEKAKTLSLFTTVLLKGGHHQTAVGLDYLIENQNIVYLPPTVHKVYEKHGSGCVLSAAISAELAKGLSMKQACFNGKLYVEKFLQSTPSLLGYHDI
ncbi:bifunctional hydroxymethylpyrimidine kinase/phosphomethylpyrimidine kinase [Flavobacterium sp. NKUCC04_CG]|uniref:bifunctional hydroxymethylpyrimidine kinase/phosphomethylpyrimidine kinase n=1 Tax=Flavobacterium sp. NKUCC04_CG TaxID=2842121 RepID=UPI001C5B138B|nr:bifunctional hydroxymethylpyrimidine kinase/phosphomethylpyrimidine kinase [Flavobacterium sp. NKUCC04_CG]MBW3518593.1 bifunctional hydroxymethylpyrimidine kinase/phosphomethylpyrimidine kinase [Flavobacterium sp. NKUCC04_CG]